MTPDLGQRSLLLHRLSNATERPGQLDYGDYSLDGWTGSGARDQKRKTPSGQMDNLVSFSKADQPPCRRVR